MRGPPTFVPVKARAGRHWGRDTDSGAGGRKEDAPGLGRTGHALPAFSPPSPSLGVGSEDPWGPRAESPRVCGSACLLGSPEARVPTSMCICIYARATLRVGMLASVNTQFTWGAGWGAGAGCVLRAHTRRRVTASGHACTPKCTVLCWGPPVLAGDSTCRVQARCAVQ